MNKIKLKNARIFWNIDAKGYLKDLHIEDIKDIDKNVLNSLHENFNFWTGQEEAYWKEKDILDAFMWFFWSFKIKEDKIIDKIFSEIDKIEEFNIRFKKNKMDI